MLGGVESGLWSYPGFLLVRTASLVSAFPRGTSWLLGIFYTLLPPVKNLNFLMTCSNNKLTKSNFLTNTEFKYSLKKRQTCLYEKSVSKTYW